MPCSTQAGGEGKWWCLGDGQRALAKGSERRKGLKHSAVLFRQDQLDILHKAKENLLTFLVNCLYFATVRYITELKLNDRFRLMVS